MRRLLVAFNPCNRLTPVADTYFRKRGNFQNESHQETPSNVKMAFSADSLIQKVKKFNLLISRFLPVPAKVSFEFYSIFSALLWLSLEKYLR